MTDSTLARFSAAIFSDPPEAYADLAAQLAESEHASKAVLCFLNGAPVNLEEKAWPVDSLKHLLSLLRVESLIQAFEVVVKTTRSNAWQEEIVCMLVREMAKRVGLESSDYSKLKELELFKSVKAASHGLVSAKPLHKMGLFDEKDEKGEYKIKSHVAVLANQLPESVWAAPLVREDIPLRSIVEALEVPSNAIKTWDEFEAFVRWLIGVARRNNISFSVGFLSEYKVKQRVLLSTEPKDVDDKREALDLLVFSSMSFVKNETAKYTHDNVTAHALVEFDLLQITKMCQKMGWPKDVPWRDVLVDLLDAFEKVDESTYGEKLKKWCALMNAIDPDQFWKDSELVFYTKENTPLHAKLYGRHKEIKTNITAWTGRSFQSLTEGPQKDEFKRTLQLMGECVYEDVLLLPDTLRSSSSPWEDVLKVASEQYDHSLAYGALTRHRSDWRTHRVEEPSSVEFKQFSSAAFMQLALTKKPELRKILVQALFSELWGRWTNLVGADSADFKTLTKEWVKEEGVHKDDDDSSIESLEELLKDVNELIGETDHPNKTDSVWHHIKAQDLVEKMCDWLEGVESGAVFKQEEQTLLATVLPAFVYLRDGGELDLTLGFTPLLSSLLTFDKIYAMSKRRDYPVNIIGGLHSYLNALPKFAMGAVRQMDETVEPHNIIEARLVARLNSFDIGKEYPKPPEEPKLQLFTDRAYEEALDELKFMGEEDKRKGIIERIKKFKTTGQYKPFAKMSEFKSCLDEMRESFPHFRQVIDHFETHAILQDIGQNIFYLPPFLLAGGPGVGKTFFLTQIAKRVKTDFKLINVESLTSGSALTGVDHLWSSAASGLFFNTIEKSKTINPIFLLDELDKTGHHYSNSNVEPSLLTILESQSARTFQDAFARIRLNMGYSIFGATANDLKRISAPILSRMDVFTIPAPSEMERRQLSKGIYISLLKDNAWGKRFKARLPEETVQHMGALMGDGAARDLRRAIMTACAKAAYDSRDELLPTDLPLLSRQPRAAWDIAPV